MPRVERDAEVSIVVLTYKSLRWLDWMMQGLDSTKQRTRYRYCIVANDASQEVKDGLDTRTPDWIDFRADDPSAHYIGRVYAAWREGVMCSKTPWCILANSDMRFTDLAIDELVTQKHMNPKSLPCSLLIENGRIPSGMPEHVQDFGTTPETFRTADFLKHAETIRKLGWTEPGRLFQPVLFDRQEFFDQGCYPEGNIGGVSGDKILFDRYVQHGFEWVTCLGSIVAHCQEGEMRDA